LDRPDGTMTWYEAGDGPPLVLMHGSWDSLLLRPLAELMADDYRCILYDQRGALKSPVDPTDPYALHLERFLGDVEALRQELGQKRLNVLGHSRGATLALFYAGRHPRRVERLALLGMGPVDSDMREVYRANCLRATPLSPAEWERLHHEYGQARRDGHVPAELDERLIRAWAPVAVYGHDAADELVRSYLAAGGWHRHTPNPEGFKAPEVLKRADKVRAPVLVLYGYQDYEPIVQAFVLSGLLPDGRIMFVNECGHMPWLDRPETTRQILTEFLEGDE
jgi:pimeloyl-ACP methyl ester carboxylesterase